jgi:hypothetical protein
MTRWRREEGMKHKVKTSSGTSQEMAWCGHTDFVSLCSSVFTENCCNELKEMHKHEVLAKICEIVGPCPSNFSKAEEIFDGIKYEITNYVIHHEFCRSHMVNTELLLWLDGRTNPKNIKKLDSFIKRYLKQCAE